ncbi:MAG: head decoration protein [Clostridiales bacterium]|nr:head decoration protein [Clostridiales bacterium]MCC8177232.1 hypothetical protein [Bacteroidales bacterium]
MSTRIDETLGTVGFDNLINGVYPPAEPFSVQLAPNQGVLERGSLLAAGDNGMELISETTTGTANAVLAKEVDTGSDETATDTVEAVAYRTGHFNTNALIVADGYEITAADKEALRSAGILISDAVEY